MAEELRYWDHEQCRWVKVAARPDAVPEQAPAPDEERVASTVEADVRSR